MNHKTMTKNEHGDTIFFFEFIKGTFLVVVDVTELNGMVVD